MKKKKNLMQYLVALNKDHKPHLCGVIFTYAAWMPAFFPFTTRYMILSIALEYF